MRRTILLLTLVGAMLLACAGTVLAQATPTPSRGAKDIIPGRYIVVLEEGAAQDTEEAEKEADEHPGLDVKHVYGEVLEGYSGDTGGRSRSFERRSRRQGERPGSRGSGRRPDVSDGPQAHRRQAERYTYELW